MKSQKVNDSNLKTQETEFQIFFFQFIQSWFLSLWYKLITCITCTPNVSQLKKKTKQATRTSHQQNVGIFT